MLPIFQELQTLAIPVTHIFGTVFLSLVLRTIACHLSFFLSLSLSLRLRVSIKYSESPNWREPKHDTCTCVVYVQHWADSIPVMVIKTNFFFFFIPNECFHHISTKRTAVQQNFYFDRSEIYLSISLSLSLSCYEHRARIIFPRWNIVESIHCWRILLSTRVLIFS